MSTYSDLINLTSKAGVNKVKLLKGSPFRYLLLSLMAGFFVGLGIFLITTVGGALSGSVSTKIVMGISFGIALSLVIMVGSELFTGNNYIMTVAALEKDITWIDAIKVWTLSYVGNLIGSLLLSWIFTQSGLNTGSTGSFILKVAESKMTLPWLELFYRGVLCNILVCIAVLCSIKMKSEAGKLIMIFWCLYAFITCGFEHSIANMTLLSAALMVDHPETVSIIGFIHNIIPVTIGNFIGGAGFLGYGYWLIGRKKD